MRHWFFLIVAIAAEVAGTSFMKWSSVHDQAGGLGIMFFLLGASYYALAQAVTRVPIGLAYAIWEGVGLVAISAVSFAFFHESIGPGKAAGIAVMLAGIVLLKRGMKNPDAVGAEPAAAL